MSSQAIEQAEAEYKKARHASDKLQTEYNAMAAALTVEAHPSDDLPEIDRTLSLQTS